MADYRLDDTDLDRWVRSGLITAVQRESIVDELAGREPPEPPLNLTNLLYYSGGLLVLVAYSFFLGIQWQDLGPGARIAVTGGTLGFFGVVSTLLLRDRRYRLPGELLQLLAVAAVPLLLFSLLEIADLVPDEPRTRAAAAARRDFQAELTWLRLALAGATLIAAAGAFRWTRSPFMLAGGAVALTAFLLDLSIGIAPAKEHYEWETGQLLVVAAMGAVALASGVALRARREREYSSILYATALPGLAVGLGPLAFDDGAAGWGVLWMLVAVGLLALSIPLQQRLLAGAGLIAMFSYLARLVFDVFESAAAALALTVIGLLVVGLGILYQRYAEPLAARLRQEPPRPPG